MESFLNMLNTYGTVVYLILFGYCALKSGWLPLFAAYGAYLGALDVWLVGLAAFGGGYLGDEIRFFVAKRFGVRWLENGKRLSKVFQKCKGLAERYGSIYIFVYRYPKGLRTIGALPIGLTDISWYKFTLFNAGSALLWAFSLVGGGYAFGATFEAIGVQSLAAASLLLLMIFLVALYRVWSGKLSKTTQIVDVS